MVHKDRASDTGEGHWQLWLGVAALLGVVGSLGVCAFHGPQAADWNAVVLGDDSRHDSACIQEIEQAVVAIIADSGLTDVQMGERDLETLVDEGAVDQSVTLYGGDEIRHWTLAIVEDSQHCAVYNHGVTEIDLATGEAAQSPDRRFIRGDSGREAVVELQSCRCVAK